MPEAGTGESQVKFSAQPSSTVTLTVSRVSGDEDITVESGQKFHNIRFLHATDKKTKKSG